MSFLREGSTWTSCLDWQVTSQEPAVAEGGPAGAINADYILIELTDFNHCAGLVPLGGMGSHLVLNANNVANL